MCFCISLHPSLWCCSMTVTFRWHPDEWAKVTPAVAVNVVPGHMNNYWQGRHSDIQNGIHWKSFDKIIDIYSIHEQWGRSHKVKENPSPLHYKMILFFRAISFAPLEKHFKFKKTMLNILSSICHRMFPSLSAIRSRSSGAKFREIFIIFIISPFTELFDFCDLPTRSSNGGGKLTLKLFSNNPFYPIEDIFRGKTSRKKQVFLCHN